jgi:deoxycytidylate deaminase
MNEESTAQDDERHGILAHFETYGWKPDPSLPDDENIMDLVFIITRAAKLKQGSMACIILRPPDSSTEESQNNSLVNRIISISNNQALYKAGNSDVHAEIVAIGNAAQRGIPTDQATAYITMPPCKNCFGALVSAGIKRIVTVYPPREHFTAVLARLGIEMVAIENLAEVRSRVDKLIAAYNDLPASKRQKSDDSSNLEPS